MKPKTKKILTTVCFSFLIISTITASFAWFINNRNVDVTTDTEITCQSGNALDIRLRNSDKTWGPWQKKLNDNSQAAKLQDITGNGLNLYAPNDLLGDENNKLEPNYLEDAKKIDAGGVGDYIEMEIQIRSMSYLDIYFSGESFIKPMILVNDPHFVGFDKDFIAGAMRVAVLERTETTAQDGSVNVNDELRMIWAPNPDYVLFYDESTGQKSFETGLGYTDYETFQYLERLDAPGPDGKLYQTHYVTSDDYVNKNYVVGSTHADNKFFNQSPILTTLDPLNPDKLVDNFAVSHLVFRIWFEGTDREAKLPLSGGHVKTKISLVGNNAKEPCSEEHKKLVDDITFARVDGKKFVFNNAIPDSGIYFSPNGYHWEKFVKSGTSGNNLPLVLDIMKNNYINQDKRTDYNFYFKYPETETNKEYIKKFEFTYTPNLDTPGADGTVTEKTK